MRIGPPPTKAQIREEFDDALQNIALKGGALPSCMPFSNEVTRALMNIALAVAQERPSSTEIAAARAALERQLAQ